MKRTAATGAAPEPPSAADAGAANASAADASAAEAGAADDLARADYVASPQALQMLGVRAQTLYAYVSRGWIRSIRQPDRKQRLYLRSDIERMLARSRARAGHGAVAASAMDHGEPIIATAITEITPDGPRYRGHSAIELARQRASYESVAELLWSGLWHDSVPGWPVSRPTKALQRMLGAILPVSAGDRLIEVFALVTLQLGLERGGVSERLQGGHAPDAAREVITTLVGCCGLLKEPAAFAPMPRGARIAEGLMRALGVTPSEDNLEAIETMLVLLADHELSPGTFGVRVAAAGGATLHGCIASALCASAGLQVARVFDRVDGLLHGASSAAVLRQRARALQARGVAVPGFDHPLYPQGDPRARVLFELAARRRAPRVLQAVSDFAQAWQEECGSHVRFELPMVALCRAMGLPPQAPSALFALARVAGWVAHVQEQRLAGQLLRPRARFVGAAGAVKDD